MIFLVMSVSFCRHARKYFTIFEDEQLQDVQHCMALLAFPTNTGIFQFFNVLKDFCKRALIRHLFYGYCVHLL
jgi:hypothetical protein